MPRAAVFRTLSAQGACPSQGGSVAICRRARVRGPRALRLPLSAAGETAQRACMRFRRLRAMVSARQLLRDRLLPGARVSPTLAVARHPGDERARRRRSQANWRPSPYRRPSVRHGFPSEVDGVSQTGPHERSTPPEATRTSGSRRTARHLPPDTRPARQSRRTACRSTRPTTALSSRGRRSLRPVAEKFAMNVTSRPQGGPSRPPERARARARCGCGSAPGR